MRSPDPKVTLICTKTCHKNGCFHAQPHERHMTVWTHQSDCWRSKCELGGLCVPLNIVWVRDERELP